MEYNAHIHELISGSVVKCPDCINIAFDQSELFDVGLKYDFAFGKFYKFCYCPLYRVKPDDYAVGY